MSGSVAGVSNRSEAAPVSSSKLSSPPPPTTTRCSTDGALSSRAATRSRWAAEVTSTLASESLSRYTIESSPYSTDMESRIASTL